MNLRKDLDLNLIFFVYFKIFSAADRANLIHSTFILSYIGAKSYSSVAFLGTYMEYSEDQLIPWQTFTYHMSKVGSLLDHRPGFHELKVSSNF